MQKESPPITKQPSKPSTTHHRAVLTDFNDQTKVTVKHARRQEQATTAERSPKHTMQGVHEARPGSLRHRKIQCNLAMTTKEKYIVSNVRAYEYNNKIKSKTKASAPRLTTTKQNNVYYYAKPLKSIEKAIGKHGCNTKRSAHQKPKKRLLGRTRCTNSGTPEALTRARLTPKRCNAHRKIRCKINPTPMQYHNGSGPTHRADPYHLFIQFDATYAR